MRHPEAALLLASMMALAVPPMALAFPLDAAPAWIVLRVDLNDGPAEVHVSGSATCSTSTGCYVLSAGLSANGGSSVALGIVQTGSWTLQASGPLELDQEIVPGPDGQTATILGGINANVSYEQQGAWWVFFMLMDPQASRSVSVSVNPPERLAYLDQGATTSALWWRDMTDSIGVLPEAYAGVVPVAHLGVHHAAKVVVERGFLGFFDPATLGGVTVKAILDGPGGSGASCGLGLSEGLLTYTGMCVDSTWVGFGPSGEWRVSTMVEAEVFRDWPVLIWADAAPPWP